MQGFDLALFQQGAAVQPSILLKHLDPNTKQEAQQDIAAYKSTLKDEREQKKQKTVQARAANLPAGLTEQQRRRNQGCLYESCMVEVDEKEGTCAL